MIHPSPHRRSSPWAGFSLTELVVVVGIIVVLAALLLPTMSSLRSASRRMVCASNLRQVGMGLLAYTADSNGFFIYGAVNRAGEGSLRWYDLLADYLAAELNSRGTVDIAGPRNVLVGCPNFTVKASESFNLGYGINMYPVLPTSVWTTRWDYLDLTWFRDIRLAMISNRTTRMMASDAIHYYCSQIDTDLYRHQGRSTAVMFDGHIRTMRSDLELTNAYVYPERGQP